MHSYVINLDRSSDRLKHMSHQLDRLGIAWSRISGVDAQTLPDTDLQNFRDQRASSTLSHRWSNGQIGCFLSHMTCLRAIAAGVDDWAMVFEDDVHISPDLPRFLAAHDWIPRTADIIRFETTYQGMRLGPAVKNGPKGFTLSPVRQGAWGTAAFAIRKDVARWLADAPARFHAPADYYFFHRTSTVAGCLETLQLNPALCVQDQYLPRIALKRGFRSHIDTGHFSDGPQFRSRYKAVMAVGRKILGKQLIPFKHDE